MQVHPLREGNGLWSHPEAPSLGNVRKDPRWGLSGFLKKVHCIKMKRKTGCEGTFCGRRSLRCHHGEKDSRGRSHQQPSRAAQAFSSTSALTKPSSFSGTTARGAPVSLLPSGLLQSEVPQPARETQPPLSESPGNICRKTPPSRGTLPRGSGSAAGSAAATRTQLARHH